MPAATPDTLGDVLAEIIQESARQAAAAPEKLKHWFQDLGELADEVKQAPPNAVDKLHEFMKPPPDWWSLLVFFLVRVSKLDRRLSVGAMQPPDWSKTVIVTFTDGPGAVIAGLALSDPGQNGFLLHSTGAVDSRGDMQVGLLAVSVKTPGAVRWKIPFTGPLVRPEQSAVIDAAISWDRVGAGVAMWTGRPGLTLPAFDFWHFRTSTLGDFETLAKKLKRLPAGTATTLGVRRVAVEARAALLTDTPGLFPPEVHEVPTAISTADAPGKFAPGSTEPSSQRADLHRRLKELVDFVAASTDEDPIVGPPLYGRWSAKVTSLDGQRGGDLASTRPTRRRRGSRSSMQTHTCGPWPGWRRGWCSRTRSG